VKSASCTATSSRACPCGGRGQRSRATCSCVVIENSLQKSKGCARFRQAFAINPIRGREREPSRDNRVCPKQHGIVPVKRRSARPSGGKTSGAERARVGPDHAPPTRGRRRKTSAVEMHLSAEVVSDQERVRSSRAPPATDLGAASMCEPLRRDPQAGTLTRRDGHDTGSVDGDRDGTTSHHGRARSKRQASIPQSHSGGVKPLGARSFVRREATPSGRTARAEPNNDSARARRDLVENERGTGARD